MSTNNKLNIGIVGDGYFPNIDGASFGMRNHYQNLRNFGDNVTIITCKIKNCMDKENVVRVKSLPFPGIDYKWAQPRTDLNFKKKLKSIQGPDIIQINSPYTLGKYFVKYARKRNIPIVFTLHTKYDEEIARCYRSKGFRKIVQHTADKVMAKVDAIIFVSPKLYTCNFVKNIDLSQIPCTFIANGTELKPFSRYESENYRVATLNKYKIDKNCILFCFVGRIIKVKNLELIIKTSKILFDHGLLFKFIIVGDGTDLAGMMNKIKGNGLYQNFIFTGNINDRLEISKIYNIATLNFFPSLYDSGSLTIAESACFNVPTMAINDATTSFAIKDNVNGFLSTNDSNACANKILRIVNDKKLYTKVQKTCHKDLYITGETQTKKLRDEFLNTIESKNNTIVPLPK